LAANQIVIALELYKKKDAAELAAKWRCPFFETSANLDINVRDAVAALVEEIQVRIVI